MKDFSVARLAGFLIFAVSGIAGPQAASAEESTASSPTKLEEVQVTGSRILRNQIEGPSPVTVITADQLEREGFSTVSDLLNSLVQVNSVAQNEQFSGGFTPNLNTVDLRGLGPGYTLVLVDGRRVPDYPGAYNGQSNAVNIGAIPTVAVERIEVLSGSASAIYGSDAVAGVINIILKKDYNGVFGSARYGKTTDGGGESWRLQAGGGHGFLDNKLRVFAAAEYLKRDPIWSFQRTETDSSFDAPTVAAQAAARSRLITDDFGQGPSGYIDPGPEVCQNFADVGLQYNFRGGGRGFYCGSTTWNSLTTLRNAEQNYSFTSRISYEISSAMQAYGFGSYWRSSALSQFSAPYWFSGTEFGTIVDATRPDDFGIGGEAVTFQRLFQPDEVGGIDAYANRYLEDIFEVGAGVKGYWNDFQYDAHFSGSRYSATNRARYFVFDKVEEYFLGQATGEAGGFLEGSGVLTYNPDYDHFDKPLTPEIYNSLSDISTDRNYSSILLGNASITGKLFPLPGGDAQFAGVLEWERQKYELAPDPGTLPATSRFWGITATGGAGQRDRYALGLEVRLPVIEQVVASLAARYDKYNDATDVDDAITYNAGLEIRPIKSVLIRGSYATSFRAPDMHYIFAGESGFFTFVDDEYKCRKYQPDADIADCDFSGVNIAGFRSGNLDLQEEDGKSYTLGIVWDPLDRLSLSFDYYSIRLNNVVGDVSISTLLITEANCRLGQDPQGNPVDAASPTCVDALSRTERLPDTGDENGESLLSVTIQPINQSVIKTSGIDASATYGLNAGSYGKFGFSLAYSHVLKFEFQQFPGDPLVNVRDGINIYTTTNDTIGFRSRITAGVNWDIDQWGFAVFGTRFGSVPSERGSYRLRPYTRYNASVRYALNPHVTFSLIGNNILSEKPPRDAEEELFPYYDIDHYDVYGRELFAQVDVKF